MGNLISNKLVYLIIVSNLILLCNCNNQIIQFEHNENPNKCMELINKGKLDNWYITIEKCDINKYSQHWILRSGFSNRIGYGLKNEKIVNYGGGLDVYNILVVDNKNKLVYLYNKKTRKYIYFNGKDVSFRSDLDKNALWNMKYI